MAKKQVKRCSVSLLIREMQIKITVRCYPTLGQEWPSSKSLHQVSCTAGRFFTSWATHWGLTKNKILWKKLSFPPKKVYITCCRGCREREPSYTLGGNVNWYCRYGEQYGGFFKKIKNRTIIWSSNPIPGHISGEHITRKDTFIPTFIAALCTTAKTWKQAKCPSTEE